MELTLVYKIQPIVCTIGSPILSVLRVVLFLLLYVSLPINGSHLIYNSLKYLSFLIIFWNLQLSLSALLYLKCIQCGCRSFPNFQEIQNYKNEFEPSVKERRRRAYFKVVFAKQDCLSKVNSILFRDILPSFVIRHLLSMAQNQVSRSANIVHA